MRPGFSSFPEVIYDFSSPFVKGILFSPGIVKHLYVYLFVLISRLAFVWAIFMCVLLMENIFFVISLLNGMQYESKYLLRPFSILLS